MGKKRIIIDGRMVGPFGHGIGNYVSDLARALSERALSWEIFFLLSASCPADSPLRSFPNRESRFPFLSPGEILGLSREIRDADLFHSPSFMSLWRYPCPHLQTVHDLNHLRFGSPLHRLYYRSLLLPSLRQAAAVTSVSGSAAAELSDWLASYGLKKEILITPNSINLAAGKDPAVLERLGLRAGEYFFCLSNPKPHKNLNFLKLAHQRARTRGSVLPLLLSVAGEATPGLVHTGPLPPPEIAALLKGAKAFFFPSLYEGFGRPPVEAALAGCVPIVSQIPPHREGLRGVPEADFLPPSESAPWEEAFLRYSREPWRKVSDAGKDWIRQTYSLDQLGRLTEAAYARALG
jgi:glycosyltransferase involved in cell wall biosynthesis